MPLNSNYIRQANERLWSAHPELDRRQLTLDSSDASLRREWMQYYNEASVETSPPEPSITPYPTPDFSFSTQPPSPVQSCEKMCTDDSQKTCPCEQMTTITFYIQKGEPPTQIVGDYVWDELNKNTPQPETGHTFIGIGEGSLSQQKAYGFYPTTSWFGETGGINTNGGFFIPGQEKPVQDAYAPENTHPYTHSKKFKACPNSVISLEKAINEDIEAIKNNDTNAPKYNLTNLQCTTWARKKLSLLGFKDPGGFTPYGSASLIEKSK